ncbi:hypothetical protein MKQ68_14635 [Chitinophaga horti]|uniref:Peptidase family C25 n=1 Tax=Chitinophaga horti TaxID=2920382 RepID=A0ABY6IY29_9BACT|nr:hypothetical protein [Chitinophaga horti]UYQ91327.1 hypothetical protein MKQ68_14635 [Chitinophaga horti]
MKTEKLIVTNLAALTRKYGSKHKSILSDLKLLQASDKKRGLGTQLVFLDKAADMQKFKAKAVTDPANAKQNKDAIDALYKHFSPDYLLIVGAQDVVPFQLLNNLLYSEDDGDQKVASDLPYACEASYSVSAAKFIAPTRVVGRLPDIPGGSDPAYFHALVQDVINHQPGSDKDYKKYFSVSVSEWQKSTEESLRNMFGEHSSLFISPVKGPKWTSSQFKPKTHFINCHGSLDDPAFYGQKGKVYPEAVNATLLAKKVTPGTIVAAECCYGAQLYNPQLTEYDQPSMANTYLQHHALAFVGSSTIAYGPAEGNGLADLITQYFLVNVIKGASTGRALLEARQRFLDEMGPTLDPYELKTIAQFYLLGDPSVTVVSTPKTTATLRSIDANTRINRRDGLEAKGRMLERFITTPQQLIVKPIIKPRHETALQAQVDTLLKQRGFRQATLMTFENTPKASQTRSGAKAFAQPVKFHVYSESATHGKFKETKVLVVKEKNNAIIGYREYVSK